MNRGDEMFRVSSCFAILTGMERRGRRFDTLRGCGGVPGVCGEEDLLKGFEGVSGDIFGVREEEVLIYCEEDIVEKNLLNL